MTRLTSYPQGTPNYVELITPDQGAAESFYRELFGWDVESVPVPGYGAYLTATKEGDRVAGIGGQLPGTEGQPAFWGVYLAVDDIEATLARVEPAGGTVEAGPFDVMEHGRSALVRDPTGVRVSLWQAGTNIGTARVNEHATPIWNELETTDVATATAFYAEVLGVTWDANAMEGGEYVALMVDGRAVGGATAPVPPDAPPRWNVYFNVDACAASVATVVELGGSVVVPTMEMPGIGIMALVADPQGASFWLMQAPDQAA